jgi:predicted metal-binding protein
LEAECFVERAKQLGALEARIMPASGVVTAAWVRMKCQFGCGGYNTNYCCPPHSPTPQQTRAVLDGYARALLIHCQGESVATPLVATLEREMFLQGFYKALAYGSGPCELCRKCAPERCAKPHQARPSMESCGIDVFATVRAQGFPIETLKDESNVPNYYGLVLID